MDFHPERNNFGRGLCVVLSIVMAIGPATQLWAQQPAQDSGAEVKLDLPSTAQVQVNKAPSREILSGNKTLLAAPNAGKIDLTYVTPQAAALFALRPHQLLTSPNTAIFPVEVASAAGIERLGINPADVVEVVLFVEPPSIAGLQYGAVIKFAKPFALDNLKEPIRAHMQPADFAGKTYLKNAHPQQPSLYMPDDRTLLAMPDITLQKTLAPIDATATSPLLERVAELPGGNDLYAMIDIASLRPLIVPWMHVAIAQQGVNFPEEAKPFLEIPNLISSIDLAFNITNPGPTVLAIHANDAASADRLEALYDLARELERKNAAKNAAEFQKSNNPIERAFGDYLERMSKSNFEPYKYERHGDDLVLFEFDGSDASPQNQLVIVAVSGILVALLLPAVQAAREAARRNQSLNNLKQLMLAMLNYHDRYGEFPAHAIYSDGGKPLLSWRVNLLPFLEEGALYSQFHLDEPWDSPHNRTLIEKMPAVFDNPNINEPGKTDYLALVGPQCVLDGSSDAVSLKQITDGLSNTIVVVEADADRAVEWTKPDDINFDPKDPHAGFGKLRPGGSNVVWADGHASFVAEDIDPQVLKAMITRDGGEVIPR